MKRLPQKPFTVFVIDDDDDNRDVIALVLEGTGADVVTAGSYDEALARLSEHAPDLVLCDLSLGDRRGEELLAEIRARGLGVDVWAISGHDVAPPGFCGLLQKPFSFEALADLVPSHDKGKPNGPLA